MSKKILVISLCASLLLNACVCGAAIRANNICDKRLEASADEIRSAKLVASKLREGIANIGAEISDCGESIGEIADRLEKINEIIKDMEVYVYSDSGGCSYTSNGDNS